MGDKVRTPIPERTATTLFSPVAVVASCVGFLLIGALQSLYGPAIPQLRTEFGLTPSAAGLALSAHFIGGVIGVLVFNRIHGRVNNRVLLGTSYLLMAVGCVAFALSPYWAAALVAALVTGLGFGGIDYGLNQLFAVGFGRRSSAMLNVLNAHFGIGAIAGPALIGLFGASRYPALFLSFAVVSAALLFFLRGVTRHEPPPAETPDRVPASGVVVRSSASVLLVFIVLYVVHVGIEAGVGGWEPTQLEGFGYSASIAASATSVYWLFFTAGRFLVAPLTLRVSEPRIIMVSCIGMTICLLGTAIAPLAPYAYAGVGLFLAPIFPTGLPWLNRAVPAARHAGAYVIAASMFGGVLAGPALGGVIQRFTIDSLPVMFIAMSVACLGCTAWLARFARV